MTRREALLVEHDGEQVGVEVCGAGPAVVLLHGAGGNRATWWQQVVPLAEQFTVVVVEARGSGRSTDTADRTGPVAGTADLEAVRVHLGLERWHLVGHSLGGWTALRYAATHPERVASVVVLNAVAGVFPPAVDEHWQRFTAELAAQGWPVQELAKPLSLTPDFHATHAEAAHLYQLVGALNPPPSPTSPAARIREHDLTDEELARLAMPVTFVAGSRDAIAPPAACAAAAAACGAGFVELDGAGHLPFWEDPAGFHRVLVELLAQGRKSETTPAS